AYSYSGSTYCSNVLPGAMKATRLNTSIDVMALRPPRPENGSSNTVVTSRAGRAPMFFRHTESRPSRTSTSRMTSGRTSKSGTSGMGSSGATAEDTAKPQYPPPMPRLLSLTLALAVGLSAAASTQPQGRASGDGAGWQVLFDGTSLDAWRGYRR